MTEETFDNSKQLFCWWRNCVQEPEMLHLDLFLIQCCPQPSQTLISTPPSPTAPSLSFLLSLTLTQWTISVVGGFYLCSQAWCRRGEGLLCSRGLCTWQSVCNREVTSESGSSRKPFPTSHTRTEARELREYQFRRNAFVWGRQDPAYHKLPCRYNRHIHIHTKHTLTETCSSWLDNVCEKFIKDWIQSKSCCICECMCANGHVHGCESACVCMFLQWLRKQLTKSVLVSICVSLCSIHTFSATDLSLT